MSKQTTTESTTEKRLVCPACSEKGRRVSVVTVRALLKDEFQPSDFLAQESCCHTEGGCKALAEDTGYRFCDEPECDVVYFAEQGDASFTKSQLKVVVGVKEQSGQRPLCYCFGHSVATIKDEIRSTGNSMALEDIRAKMNTPGCRCETENPSGACCLGSVAKGIKIAQAELDVESADTDSGDRNDNVSAKSAAGRNRGEVIAKVGTLISAVMASACCWLPLLLLAIGVSGAGIASTLEAYRPAFIVITIGFLTAAFHFTYRPKKATASGGDDCCAPETLADQDCCAAPTASVDTCCATTTSKRGFNMMTLNKVMLWGITVLAIGFLLFPTYVGALLGTGDRNKVTAEMNQAVFKIDGMTCDGCSSIVETAIGDVPGVLAVEVNYEKKEATVGTEICCPVPVEAIESALKSAGYTGTAIESNPSALDQTEP